MTATSGTEVLATSVSIEHQQEVYSGAIEYFPSSKALILTDPDRVDPLVFTVRADEAPEAFSALGDREVLIRNWTENRGSADQLQNQGIIELTGQSAAVGMFNLNALVARVQ